MSWDQQEIRLAPRERGFHLITDEITRALPGLGELEVGLLHLQLLHTSASLTLNENADPDVRHDLDAFLRDLIRAICPISGTPSRGRTTCPLTWRPACSAPS